jgi:hypothetical protein
MHKYVYTVICPICDNEHKFHNNPFEEDDEIHCSCKAEFCPSEAIVEIAIDEW